MTSNNAKRYVYVVVIVSSDHNAKAAVIAGPNEYKGKSLSRVLEQGWVPVRETPMGGNGEFCCSLVVLEGTTIAGDLPTESFTPPAVEAPKPIVQRKPAPGPAPAPAPAPAAAPKMEKKAPTKPAPAPVPAPIDDTDLGIELADEPVTSPAPKAKEGAAKMASESDVSFDFLENLE